MRLGIVWLLRRRREKEATRARCRTVRHAPFATTPSRRLPVAAATPSNAWKDFLYNCWLSAGVFSGGALNSCNKDRQGGRLVP